MRLACAARSPLVVHRLVAALALALAACGSGKASPPAGGAPGGGDPPPDPPAVQVTVLPETLTLLPNDRATFTARVDHADDDAVSWTIEEGAAGGTVDAGRYTAPASVAGSRVFHVVATSRADPTRRGVAAVTVTDPSAAGDLVKLRKLATKVGFFQHKSVGQNLIDGNGDGHGLAAVRTAAGDDRWTVGGDRGWTTLPDRYTQDNLDNLYGPTSPQGVRLLNLMGGENGDPLSKIAAMDAHLARFGPKLEASVDAQGVHVGYALMKWCFADFRVGGTAPATVHAEYKRKLAEWKGRWPHVRFLHVTVPITAAHPDNAVREAMSDLLRADAELQRDGLFDLADLESRNAETGAPDAASRVDGVRALRPAYTGDACHPDQPAEEDFLGHRLVDFLAAQL